MQHSATKAKLGTGSCGVRVAYPVSSLLAVVRVVPGEGSKCATILLVQLEQWIFPFVGSSVMLLQNNEALLGFDYRTTPWITDLTHPSVLYVGPFSRNLKV